jgi:protein subunit release factor A
MNFSREIYDDAKRLFPDGAVETLVSRPAGAPSGTLAPAVRLVHTSTGIEIVCGDFPTQIENYIAAAIRLRIACDKRDA